MKTVPPELQTSAESKADVALTEFDEEVAERRARLVEAQKVARAAADGMREELLYGRGNDLEGAVAQVLSEAGIVVEHLDAALGESASADLLCTLGPRRVLVEIKSVGGNASETLYAALVKHVDAWRANPNRAPIDGGVLVINHEHKKDPVDRSPSPYTRQAFLDSQQYPVVTTMGLFNAWRTGDAVRARALLFGDQFAEAQPEATPPPDPDPEDAAPPQERRRKRWLPSLRSSSST